MQKLKTIKIKSITPVKSETVYDISVNNDSSYISSDGTLHHNSGFVYASSIMIAMQKLKLKEDEDGNKVAQVNGIRSKCKIMKSRYSKPFEQCELKIPYSTGIDPYSGLLEMFEQAGLVIKQGNRLKYEDIDTKEEIIMFRKAWGRNENGCLDLVMSQFNRHPLIAPLLEEELSDEGDEGLSDEVLENLANQELDQE